MKEMNNTERILQEIEEVEREVRMQMTKEELQKRGIKVDDSGEENE